jgi:hypothetical protein
LDTSGVFRTLEPAGASFRETVLRHEIVDRAHPLALSKTGEHAFAQVTSLVLVSPDGKKTTAPWSAQVNRTE